MSPSRLSTRWRLHAAALIVGLSIAGLLAGCQPQGDAGGADTAGEAATPALATDAAAPDDGGRDAAGMDDGSLADDTVDRAVFDDQPAEDVPPATAPALLPPPPSRDPGPARIDGYGPLRFGMSAEEMRAAWNGDSALVAAGEPSEGGTCHYLWPADADPATRPAFMLEEGRFVRYDVTDPEIEAPGGGRVGARGDAIRALYVGRYETMPHKYVEGGQYLRVTGLGAGASADGVLVFVVDADGRVNAWRAGRPPQVDYVEGCS
ncbi:lectin [Marilutibacter chinensis]|uniref:Lectin n=1 Tax=Marilutibacter chinensis TaxID=2912247 RepID=A0ABS9HSP2_9GAMM|nr:lectin [Lysobacter chinensis]MCF7221367.1 lectin [Lysobacter chinensis]